MKQSNQRSTQVLKMLYDHGPLSIRAIVDLININYDTKTTSALLREVITRLKNKKLIITRFNSLPSNIGNFYQLSHRKEVREYLANLLDVEESNLLASNIRDQELLHSEQCAIWAANLQKLYPEANVIREHLFLQSHSVKNTLMARDNYIKIKPDIMIYFPAHADKPQTNIAIEIERSRKAHKHLVKKLRRFADETKICGVLYVCSENSIIENLRQIFQSKVLSKNVRISYYGNNFLVFCSEKRHQIFSEQKILSTNLHTTTLKNWIDFLRDHHDTERRTFAIEENP